MPFLQSNFDKAMKVWRDKGLAMVGDKAEENVSGKVLQTRSGDLLKDVQEHQQIEGPAAFSVGTSLVYGKAWEMGFSRKAYTVKPVKAKALRFQPQGHAEFIFRLRAEIPAQTFPAKSFLRPAIADNREALKKLLGQQIRETRLFSTKTIEVKIGVA